MFTLENFTENFNTIIENTKQEVKRTRTLLKIHAAFTIALGVGSIAIIAYALKNIDVVDLGNGMPKFKLTYMDNAKGYVWMPEDYNYETNSSESWNDWCDKHNITQEDL